MRRLLIAALPLALLCAFAAPAAFSGRPVLSLVQLKPTAALKSKLRSAFAVKHHGIPSGTTGPVVGKICYRVPGLSKTVGKVCSIYQLQAASYNGRDYALAVFFNNSTLDIGQPERFATSGSHWVDLGSSTHGRFPGIPCAVITSWGRLCAAKG